MKPNILLSCVLWLLIWACLVIAGLPLIRKLPIWSRLIISFGTPLVLLLFFWTAIAARYREQTTRTADHSEATLNFIRGGLFPRIHLEIYWGVTNGMVRTFGLKERDAPLCVVSIENTNAFPVYDLRVVMLRPYDIGEKFNKGWTNIAIMNAKVQHAFFTDPFPTNRITYSFRVDTRAGVTLHNFNFIMSKHSWGHSNNVFDMTAGKTIVEDVSPGFSKLEPVPLRIEHLPLKK